MSARDESSATAGEPVAPESCARCVVATVEAESNLPSFDGQTLTGAGWARWTSDMSDLLELMADGPTRVVILQAPDDRYLQVMIGHGRCVVEVSTSTTLSDRGLHTELIAAALIDCGFDPPTDYFGTDADGSPNWAVDLDVINSARIAAFVARVFRDLMQVDGDQVTASAFVIDRPCSSCRPLAA